MSDHAARKEAAKRAIDQVYQDPTVDRETVIDSLEDLIGDMETMVDGMKEDIRRENREAEGEDK